MNKFKVTQETIDALLDLQHGLNYIEDNDLLKHTDRGSDFCTDLLSDVLTAIGKDYEWWCEQ